MKIPALACLSLALILQQKCDISHFASPEAIKAKTEEAIQPYFPKVKGVILPGQHAILALTCVHGVSSEFVVKLAQSMAADPSITQPLNMVRYAPLLGGAQYNNFVLVFDGGTVWYDINTRVFAFRPLPPAGLEKYDHDCAEQQ